MRKSMSLLTIFILAFMSLVSCSGKGAEKISKDDLPANSVYSQTLGKAIQLNMTKDQVDELLGEGKLEYENYIYQPDNLIIQYSDGKINSIMLQYPNQDWITRGKFTIDSSKNEIVSFYKDAKNKADPNKNELIYGYDSNNALSDSHATYGIAYVFGEDDKVKAYSITSVG